MTDRSVTKQKEGIKRVRLDFEQRARAVAIEDEISDDAYATAGELIYLRDLAKLASELCTAVDREADDIGGSRPSLTILREIGAMCDELEKS